MLKDGLEHCIFVREQAISICVQGAAFQVRNAQLTTYVEKMQSSKKKTKVTGNPREKWHTYRSLANITAPHR